MTTPRKCYAELIALAQLYIFQEYSRGQWIETDRETFERFKAHALKGMQKTAVPPRPIAPLPPDKVEVSKPLSANIQSPAAKPTEAEKAAPAPPQAALEASLPEEKASAPQKTEITPKRFKLEPMTEAPPLDYSELRKLLNEKFPNISLLPIPECAASMPKSENPQVILLTFQENGRHLAFIQNLAKAVQLTLGPAKTIAAASIENEGKWDEFLKTKGLRLIIASYSGLQTLPGLMRYFKESPKQGRHYLDRLPVCLLSDIEIYLKEPQLKLPLWQSIQALLKHGK